MPAPRRSRDRRSRSNRPAATRRPAQTSARSPAVARGERDTARSGGHTDPPGSGARALQLHPRPPHPLRHPTATVRVPGTDHGNHHARGPRPGPPHRPGDLRPGTARANLEAHTTHPAYGAERATRELTHQELQIGRRRVTRPMREHGITGITRRSRRNLTKPDHDTAGIPDLRERRFTTPMPGLKPTGDINDFPTDEGRVHLATVLDPCSKKLIGHAIAAHMRASLTIEAVHRRTPGRPDRRQRDHAHGPRIPTPLPRLQERAAPSGHPPKYQPHRIPPRRRRRRIVLRHPQNGDRHHAPAEPPHRAPRHRSPDPRIQPATPTILPRPPDPRRSHKRLAAAHGNGSMSRSSVENRADFMPEYLTEVHQQRTTDIEKTRRLVEKRLRIEHDRLMSERRQAAEAGAVSARRSRSPRTAWPARPRICDFGSSGASISSICRAGWRRSRPRWLSPRSWSRSNE